MTTVFVVVREPQMRADLHHQLDVAGYHVLSIGDLERSLDFIATNWMLVDIAIVDLDLVYSKRPHVLRELEDRNPQIQFVLIQNPDPEVSAPRGHVIISNPVSAEDLVKVVLRLRSK